MALRHSQNFLHQPALVERLLDCCRLTPTDHVFEIGPGRGIITRALARRCGSVTAVEADAQLARALSRRFADQPAVKIIHGNALRTPLPNEPYKVFANPPFDRTADLLRRLLDSGLPPDECGLVLQEQAARKHLGLGRATLVGTLRRPWYDAAIVHRFHRGDFRPAPAVDGVLVRIVRRAAEDVPVEIRDHPALFRDFVTAAFTGGRGTLRQNLAHLYGRREFQRLARHHGFDRDAAPGDLAWPQWRSLFDDLVQRVDPVRRGVLRGAYESWQAQSPPPRPRQRSGRRTSRLHSRQPSGPKKRPCD